jgi:hypothetical protein
MAGRVDLSAGMVGTRSTARAAWAAIVGVAIGAALVAGANEPAPASNTPAGVAHAQACPDGVRGTPACAERRVSFR